MRRTTVLCKLVLAVSIGLGASTSVCAEEEVPSKKPSTCGTLIEWASSPKEAWSEAEQRNKLVFMMHVSGNFAEPEFT